MIECLELRAVNWTLNKVHNERRDRLCRRHLVWGATSHFVLNCCTNERRLGIAPLAVTLAMLALVAAVGGCAIQRAQIAQDARVQMVGMSREQVLACMGPPANKAAEGQTEVWSYNSGDGTTVASGSASYGSFSATSSRRFCHINVVMSGAAVVSVNYQGPTGGLITAGEQCAYAVDACVKFR